MSGRPDDATVSPEIPGHPGVAPRFEAAWLRALRGGEPPRIEPFLAGIAEPDRSAVAAECEAIERRYRSQLASVGAQTLAIEADGPMPGSTDGGTRILPPDPGPISAVDAPFPMDLGFADPDASFGPDSLPVAPSQATMALPDSRAGSDGPPSSHEAGTVAIGPDGLSLPSADEPGDGRPRVKGYEIVEELGRGGMGVVYKARQKGLNRLVAIKMVLGGEHASEDGLARFKVEAEAVASIQHPNIVQIYEVGDKNGLPYFSLEFIEGGSLQQKIDGKPQDPREAAEIVHQLALGMRSVHERG